MLSPRNGSAEIQNLRNAGLRLERLVFPNLARQFVKEEEYRSAIDPNQNQSAPHVIHSNHT